MNSELNGGDSEVRGWRGAGLERRRREVEGEAGEETPYVDNLSHLWHPGSQWFRRNAGLHEYSSHCCSGKMRGSCTRTQLLRGKRLGSHSN